MIIRNAQISAMEGHRRMSFVNLVTEKVAWRDESSGPSANRRSTIEGWINEAERLAIVNEDDVFQYVQLRAYLGERLGRPEFAWVEEYLREWSSPARRIGNVIERLRFGTETET